MSSIQTLSIAELQAQSDRLQSLLGELQVKIGDVRAQLNTMRAELEKRLRPAPEPRLSDHALLRYLERVKGVDVEGARAEIMTPSVIQAVKAGASAVVVRGCKMPIKEGCIVTVLDSEQRLKRKTQKGNVIDADDSIEEQLADAACELR